MPHRELTHPIPVHILDVAAAVIEPATWPRAVAMQAKVLASSILVQPQPPVEATRNASASFNGQMRSDTPVQQALDRLPNQIDDVAILANPLPH